MAILNNNTHLYSKKIIKKTMGYGRLPQNFIFFINRALLTIFLASRSILSCEMYRQIEFLQLKFLYFERKISVYPCINVFFDLIVQSLKFSSLFS